MVIGNWVLYRKEDVEEQNKQLENEIKEMLLKNAKEGCKKYGLEYKENEVKINFMEADDYTKFKTGYNINDKSVWVASWRFEK